MLTSFPDDTKIYLARGCTDLRKQIDDLAAMVVQSFGQDPCRNALYLFCGEEAAASILSTGKGMASSSSISDLRTVSSNGPELHKRFAS
jgi:hypothetical protein